MISSAMFTRISWRFSARAETPQRLSKSFSCHTYTNCTRKSFPCHTSKIAPLQVLSLPHIRETGGVGVLGDLRLNILLHSLQGLPSAASGCWLPSPVP